jgi:heptosyltransferase II
MNKILIIQTRPGIGDAVLFLSAKHEIAKNNRNSELFLVTKGRSRAKDLLKDDKYIKNILYTKERSNRNIRDKLLKYLDLWQLLKKIKFQKAYIFHHSIGLYLICKILSIKHIYHYGFVKKNENISKKIFLTVLKWLKIKTFQTTPKIFLKKTKLNNNKNIIIGIGSSGITRRWPLENFTRIIKLINSKKKYNFYLVAGKNEEKEANQIIKYLKKNTKIKSLCDKSIYEVLTYIKNSKLYVGTDSAFMHISAGLGVDSYGLFGDTPTNYAEYSRKIHPIIPEGYSSIGHGSNAMKKISTDLVFEKIRKII